MHYSVLEQSDPGNIPIDTQIQEEQDPYQTFSYDIAVAQEIKHHFPLHIGKPVLTAEGDLKAVAIKAAERIAPKGHWSFVELTMPNIDFLRGTYFGLDANMNAVMEEALSGASQKYSGVHRAIIALGSNIGNRIQHIEDALAELETRGLAVQKVSPLYETKAMYVLDQDNFLNGVCEIQTTLGPLELLDVLQDVERTLGRVKIVDKGPRNIDLDIILYDEERISHDRLLVPHKLMLEREFVLEPLARLLPNGTLPSPDNALSFRTHLLSLQEKCPTDPRPSPVVYVHQEFPLLKPSESGRPTHVMAILNITPDSFSDAGSHFEQDVETLTGTIRRIIRAGATIIDVGGQSTRPSSTLLGAREEINRVVPVVRLIRSLPEARNIAISVDTFYARVAKASIDSGADIINDISGGDMDPEMFSTVAAAGKTMIISHTRGTPQTMSKLTHYENGVVAGVAEELTEKVQGALDAGIRPWRIILDPGIGFAKNQEQNLELLRDFSRLRNYEGLRGYPWLVGTSRKKFIGTITGVQEAQDRIWGTAATVTASIREGADIIRIHDVEQMVQVIKMSDAIYRVGSKPQQKPSEPNQKGDWNHSGQVDYVSDSKVNPEGTRLPHFRKRSDKMSTEKHPFYHSLLGDNAIVTDGLNTADGKPRR